MARTRTNATGVLAATALLLAFALLGVASAGTHPRPRLLRAEVEKPHVEAVPGRRLQQALQVEKPKDYVEVEKVSVPGRRLQQAKQVEKPKDYVEVEKVSVPGRRLQQAQQVEKPAEIDGRGRRLLDKCSSCVVCSILVPVSGQPVGCIQCFTDGCL